MQSNMIRRVSMRLDTCTAILGLITLATWLCCTSIVQANGDDTTRFRRVQTQFIAALGDPKATSGTGAETWGHWRVDPGPRGVWLRDYDALKKRDGIAPARWQFDNKDWWLDENGLLMEKPEFPISPGKYVVTGDREAVTILTIHPEDSDGSRRWELEDATLYDVTHLPCRSARYTSNTTEACSPATAEQSLFPVKPGGLMPSVSGCMKQDYAVLFIVGVAVDN